MYFDLNYLHSSRNELWKSQIDHSIAEKDWYLRNKNKFGNARYVMKRAFIYYVSVLTFILSTLCVAHLWYPQYVDFESVIESVFFLVPVVLIIFTYLHAPKGLSDNLFFHFEYKTTAIAISVGYAFYISHAVILLTPGTDDTIYFIFFALSVISCLSIPSLLSTVLIPIKIQNSRIWVCCVNLFLFHLI